jgi:ribosomal-protein-serine acetyltransferase
MIHHHLALRVDQDLGLRLLRVEDAERVLAWREGYKTGNPHADEWIEATGTLEGVRNYIESGLKGFGEARPLRLAVVFRGELAGIVGIDLLRSTNAAISYMLGPAYRGKGLITRSCAALIAFAFEAFPRLNRIGIDCDEKNSKSCAIPERLGFRKEGVLIEYIRYAEVWGDLVQYGLMRREWRPCPGACPTGPSGATAVPAGHPASGTQSRDMT